MRRPRGMLIPILLLITLLIVLCMAELGRQPFQYRAASRVILSSQAKALAQSGLEDFRLKWTQDSGFPPSFPEGNNRFTYLERMTDWQTGKILGFFRVTVDGEWRWAPYRIYKVSAEGLVGPAQEPVCLYQIDAVFDIEPAARVGAGVNANFGKWIEWRESPI